MAELRPKIVKLAKVIGGLTGTINKIDENAPEYYCMADILTDDEADVAIACGLRHERTVEYLAKKVGKSVDEVQKIAEHLAWIGIFRITTDPIDGKDRFWMQIFAPGIMEMLVNNRELLETHPEVGRAFEEYTRIRMATMAPMLPNGYGLMRVLPIESAIKDIPGVSDLERISYYLDKYDTFSVSACSCRSSRRIIGEGCGHLEEEMCLQIGKGAEHFIRTGRARAITREEAEEIIHRAEENGLMHDVTNIDGKGGSLAICNCCACSCFGLRVGLLYGARDAIRSNFTAYIDEEKCVACGQCVENCPANALQLGQKLCTKEALPEAEYRKMSEHNLWSEKDWNVDYRENREDVVPTGTAPCKTACPAHIAVQGYLRLAALGQYKEALELIKKENPFPAICGRVCNHRCETECTRGSVDEAVAIDEVKRFIAEQELDPATRTIPPMLNQIGRPYPEKIAIIGAGPAGMTAAYYLAQKGYTPTVFDKAKRPGGMMMNGLPGFRLEKDVVEAEIDILREMGVDFRCGVEVGKDVTIPALREQGYKAFYLAIGLQDGGKLNVPGDDAEGVIPGIDFIKRVNSGEDEVKLSGKVVVIGGGSIGADVARTAARCGAESVTLYCLESYDEMPMGEEDQAECKHDGVMIRDGWGQTEVVARDGKCASVRFRKCLSVTDEAGRFAPTFDDTQTEEAECTTVLYCIGLKTDWGKLLEGTKVELTERGLVKADPLTYQTAEPDIFAGGDAYTGQQFIIDAIAAGKEAAISLHRIVHPGQTLTLGRDRRNYRALDKGNILIDPMGYDHGLRQIPGYNAAKEKTFGSTRVTFTEEQVRKEAERCLKCGATKVDAYLCIGCGQCTTKCMFDAIHLEKTRDWHADRFENMPIKVAEHLIKRTGKIARNAAGKR